LKSGIRRKLGRKKSSDLIPNLFGLAIGKFGFYLITDSHFSFVKGSTILKLDRSEL